MDVRLLQHHSEIDLLTSRLSQAKTQASISGGYIDKCDLVIAQLQDDKASLGNDMKQQAV